jgi:N-acetylmuramoyl-L-alanine amidase
VEPSAPSSPAEVAAKDTTMRRIAALAAPLLALLGAWSPARAHGPGPVLPLEFVLPARTEILARALEPFDMGLRLDLYLRFPGADVPRISEAFLETVVRSALEDELDRGVPVTGVIPWVAVPERGWVPMPALLPVVPPPPVKPGEALVAGSPTRGGRKPGFLSGRTVYVSAGHGFTWTAALGRWAPQRGNTNGVLEDFVSAETINHYLVHYLENAGAQVFTVRERDMNPRMVIVDDGGTEGGRGSYRESGAWSDAPIPGFAPNRGPWSGTTNPFSLGKSRTATTVSGAATATATYVPEIPTAGLYHVYASWSVDPDPARRRTGDAHIIVRHAGGEAHLRLDQRRHGGTWYPLGQWYFEAGQDETRGAVIVANDSLTSAGAIISVDAIRFGGGIGDAARGTDPNGGPKGVTSGRPRWEENARYHAQFNGAPGSVYAYTSDERNDDVGSRPRYAAWQNEVGEDAVYVAWHTNAPNPARGTISFVYGPNPPNGEYNFTGVAGSDRLGLLLHNEIINDIKKTFDPDWRDRGLKTAYFGEINKSHNPEMPAVLVEVAFHDTEADAVYLRDPRFRQVVARSYYQGIVKYFAERDGVAPVLLPEPPTHVRAAGIDSNTARITWRAPVVDANGVGGHAATGYRIYRSADGRAFDDGVAVPGNATSFDVHDLVPGEPAFFKVTATNAGGESHASVVVGVATACDGPPEALVVHGFYRLDQGMAVLENLPQYSLGTLYRLLQDRMNRFDAIAFHAPILIAAGIPFDSAEATAVEDGDVALAPYRFVDWALGEESTSDETFSKDEQVLLEQWLGIGRTLMTSGAELGWDLGNRGDETDRAFLAKLGVDYATDDSETYGLLIPGGGSLTLDDGTRGQYDVDTPDILTARPGGEVVLNWAGPVGRAAGVRYRDAARGYTTLVFAAPLEAVGPASERDAWLAGLLEDIDVARVPADGCIDPVEPGPEPMAEVGGDLAVEPAPTDVSGGEDATTSHDAVSGARVIEVRRDATASIRVVEGGCAMGDGAGGAGLLLGLLVLLRLRRNLGRAAVLQRNLGRAAVSQRR